MMVSWRPVELRLAVRHELGQAALRPLKVVVVDANGRPMVGAQVEYLRSGGQAGIQETDSHGVATFEGVTGPADIRVTYKDLVLSKRLSADDVAGGDTVFIQFQLCVSEPLIRPIDIAIIGGAAAMVAAGAYFKVRPLETVGEIAVGATIFSFIYRLQCL